MKSALKLFGLLVAAHLMAFAKPTVNAGGVLNAASYSRVGLPNSSLAKGTMFVAFGSELGSVSDLNALSFPLQKTMLGTSVQVTVSGTTVDALMIYTTPTQVAAILPSNTPTGNGTLRVTVNGVVSDPVNITVVQSTFGIFTRNSAGSGPAIIQRFVSPTELPLVEVTNPASAGQVMIMWGTGLGPVNGNEAAGPIPGDLKDTAGVEVYVGGQKAELLYAGRAGCCAGIDQVNFKVPDNVTGCYVTVTTVANGIVSNFATMAIAAPGQPCSDANGLSSSDFSALKTNGNVKIGTVDLTRFQVAVPVGTASITITSDTASGTFGSYSANAISAFRGVTETPSVGSCAVSTFVGLNPLPVDPIRPSFLSAGNLTVTGPRGQKAVPAVSTGLYNATVGGIALDQILTGTPIDNYLDPGNYTFSGSGATVGAFNTSLTIPNNVTWTNQNSISTINRTQPLRVTWTGGTAGSYVLITSISLATTGSGPQPTSPGAAFACVARAEAGEFTVPAYVLAALPGTTAGGLFPSAFMLVGVNGAPVKFNASGLDVGYFTYRSQSGKSVTFQ